MIIKVSKEASLNVAGTIEIAQYIFKSQSLVILSESNFHLDARISFSHPLFLMAHPPLNG